VTAWPGLLAQLRAHVALDHVEELDLARVRTLAEHAAPWDRSRLVHVTGSAVVVHPPTGRVLLRWHERMGSWLQVGGHGDPGEDAPLAVALREGAEETHLPDLAPWPDRERPALLHVVVVPVPAAGDEPAHEHADLRFVLATHRPDDARPEKPSAPLRWLTVDDALDAVGEDNLRETLRRVAALLAAGGAAA
jgi:8-oxo-dGTP pyrophosphatase MutT (NUDIX family)